MVRMIAAAAIRFLFPDARKERRLKFQMVFLFFTSISHQPPSLGGKDMPVFDPYDPVRHLGDLPL